MYQRQIIYKLLALLLTVFAAACSEKSLQLEGYVEGEYIYISATSAGTLKETLVKRGQSLTTGDKLFMLDDVYLQTNVSQAEAKLLQANSNFNNISTGKRFEEIAIIKKQQEQVNARLNNALIEYERAKKLVTSDAISKSELDRRRAEYDALLASKGEIEAQVKLANMGGRIDEINAARAAIDIANQELIRAKKQLEESWPLAPQAAYVDNVFFNKGEFVAAGMPVISLLPPENIKIRFFIAQELLPKLKIGQDITVECDGCTAAMLAKISYISANAEYTPPVIYSMESRKKMVFMVEAEPLQYQVELRPGLPVDIKLLPVDIKLLPPDKKP